MVRTLELLSRVGNRWSAGSKAGHHVTCCYRPSKKRAWKSKGRDGTPAWEVGASTRSSSPPQLLSLPHPSLDAGRPSVPPWRTPGGEELQALIPQLRASGYLGLCKHPTTETAPCATSLSQWHTAMVPPAPNHHPIADRGQVHSNAFRTQSLVWYTCSFH